VVQIRILNVNKFFYVSGGSETHYFALRKLLQENGHEVIDFSMTHERNFDSDYKSYFIDKIDYNKDSSLYDKLRLSAKIVYSSEARQKISAIIRDTEPDIAHLHIFQHQMSPSILGPLKEAGIPIVYTCHDYKMLCPNYKLYVNNSVCEECLGGNYINCLKKRCHKDSLLRSLPVTAEAYLHRFLRSYDAIGKIICPSNYMRDRLIQSGISEKRLVFMPHFVSEELYDAAHNVIKTASDTSILYFGRLSDEKGIELLFHAKKMLPEDIKLKIVGTGPIEGQLKKMALDMKLKNVEFLGFKSGEELYAEIKSSRCTIIPTMVNEVFGLTIIESYAFGTPVIGSIVGGVPEVINEGKTGFLFERGNPEKLALQIRRMFMMSDAEYQSMSRNCLKELEKYAPKDYYLKLMKVYNSLLDNNTKPAAHI